MAISKFRPYQMGSARLGLSTSGHVASAAGQVCDQLNVIGNL